MHDHGCAVRRHVCGWTIATIEELIGVLRTGTYLGLPKWVTASANWRRPRESGDPAAFVQETLDSRFRGKDDMRDPGVTHFGNGP
jgi:hypothetical protein